MDSAGNIFIPDFNNHVVRKVTKFTGKISTVAGTIGQPGTTGNGGPATSAKFTNPERIAIDSSGNLFIFIAEVNNQAIRKVEAVAAAKPLPSLSTWGLIALVGLMAGAGLVMLRRREARQA